MTQVVMMAKWSLLLVEEILLVEVGSLSHYLQGFVPPMWFSLRISEPSTVVSTEKGDKPTVSPFNGGLRLDEVNFLVSS